MIYDKPRTRSDFWYDILWTCVVIVVVVISVVIASWFDVDLGSWFGI